MKPDERDLSHKFAYRLPDVVHVLSMSLTKIKLLIRSKKLGHIKEDGVTLVTRNQILEYLQGKEEEYRGRD